MAHNQRHKSDPFVCYDNLLISENTGCFRRGSASLVEMLQCKTNSLSETVKLSPCPYTSQKSGCVKDQWYNCAQNMSLLSPDLSSHRRCHPDSASHFSLPLLPNNSQPPLKCRLSATQTPQPHLHCKACMSVLLRDRTKGGGSLGLTHTQSFSTPTQFSPLSKPGSPKTSYLSQSPLDTIPPLLASHSSPSSNSPTPLTSPMHLSSSSQAVLPWSLYDGGNLTLLNHCLHQIVSRRTSSPTLSERGTNYPMHCHWDFSSSRVEHIDKSQSLDVPLFCSSNLDRKPLLSPNETRGRSNPLVCW